MSNENVNSAKLKKNKINGGRKKVPTKHIEAKLWDRVEQRTVDAVTELGVPLKDTEVLQYVLIVGLATIQNAHIAVLHDMVKGQGDDPDEVLDSHKWE